MTPTPKELFEGQKACERIEAFQRTRGPFESLAFLLLFAGFGIYNAFEKGGWRPALGIGVVWSILTVIGLYQFQKQKKRAESASIFIANLKAKYGDAVYSSIQKSPHSLYYNIFQKRFPLFNRRSVKFP